MYSDMRNIEFVGPVARSGLDAVSHDPPHASTGTASLTGTALRPQT